MQQYKRLVFVLIRKLFLVIGVVLCLEDLSAQTNLRYPVTFSQFFHYNSFINSAATGLEPRLAITIGNQFNTGNFSRIRNFFALGEFRTKKDEYTSRHAFGVVFTGNQEGELLSLSRGYMQYAFHIALSESWKLSGGIAAGAISFNADQTSTSSKVSSIVPDGSMGLFLYRDEDQIGISSGQIFNNSFQVITERIPLKRYYRFTYSRNQPLTESISFTPALQYTQRNENAEFDIAPKFLLSNRILLGVSYRYLKGSAYFLGLKNIEIAGTYSDLNFSYNAPWPAKNPVSISSFELTLLLKYK